MVASDVKKVLVQEFNVDEELYNVELVDSGNNNVDEGCTVQHMCRNTLYKGANKIYLLLRPIWMMDEPPQLEECIQYVREEERQNQAPDNPNHPPLSDDTSLVPVHRDRKFVKYALRFAKGYREISSAYGDFLLVPEADYRSMAAYDELDGAALVTPPLKRYLNCVCQLTGMEVMDYKKANAVWCLPSFLLMDYEQWKNSLI